MAARRNTKKDEEQVAASFAYMGQLVSVTGTPSSYSRGRRKMVEYQKFRNNYAAMDLRSVCAAARHFCERNWFLRPVTDLRQKRTMDGFVACDEKGKPLPADSYAFASLAHDIAWAELKTSSVIAIWRKGVESPIVSILASESVEYDVVGGIEILRLHCAAPRLNSGKVPKAVREKLVEDLGAKMARVQISGGTYEIVKGLDEDWDFEVMADGAECGCLLRPAVESILDSLDFLELMNVGDWNLAWFRKDVLRLAKKGYKGTGGAGVTGGVDITKPQIKSIGDGMGKISGNANIPVNHDVDFSYLTLGPESFKPDQVETHIDRIMLYGSFEGAVLLGNFSQQDGAAATLMSHSRAGIWARREAIARFLNRIFAADEFNTLEGRDDSGNFRFRWSDRLLYSPEEIARRVTATGDGTASTQTRREWMDLDSEIESQRLKQEHADRTGYAPPFEAKQGLLPAMFEDLAKAVPPTSGGGEGENGRPSNPAAV